ncbi:MAG: rRNA maturation RNase YbeY [Cyanobacteriota bacterium]|nr:rRNA maturation RNase YbeY [Cyanobacteriota bacterium]
MPDLDLAFTTQPDLPTDLYEQAEGFADPDPGESRWQALLSFWLAELSDQLAVPLRAQSYSLGLSFVDDAAIRRLNYTWRQRDEPTDVLSFSALEPDSTGVTMPAQPLGKAVSNVNQLWPEESLELGDIVISLERASCQARHHEHSLPWELQFLACHGLLHLLGWDHPNDERLQSMLACQDRLLQAARRAALA